MALRPTKMFNLTGVGTSIQFGKAGSQLKLNGTAIQARNSDDSAYVKMHAAHPAQSDINGVATVGFVLANNNPIVSQEIYDNAGTPAYSPTGSTPSVGDILVCTEATTGFTAGHVYRCDVWDTDVATSTWTDVTVDGFAIVVTENLNASGGVAGNFTFTEDHIYVWDGTTWDDIGPAASADPPSQYNRGGSIAWNDAATTNDIGNVLTNNGYVTRVLIEVTTAWNGTTGDATVTVGNDNGTVSDFAAADDSDLQETGVYIIDQYNAVSSGDTIQSTRTADTSADESAGAANILVFLSNPNSEA